MILALLAVACFYAAINMRLDWKEKPCSRCGETRMGKHLIEDRCMPDCWTRQTLIDHTPGRWT